MFLHVTLLGAAVVTNFTFEWFIILMNFLNMFLQGTLLRVAVVTNVTFERFFIVMY